MAAQKWQTTSSNFEKVLRSSQKYSELSEEVHKSTFNPNEAKDFIFYFCKMGRTRPWNRQQRAPRNPRNRERFDELVELNGKIQEVKTLVYASKFKQIGSIMNHLKEIEEQMNQMERIFNVFQYNLTNDWYEDDRQAQQVQQAQQVPQVQQVRQVPQVQRPQVPEFQMKPPEDDDFTVYMSDMFKDQNF